MLVAWLLPVVIGLVMIVLGVRGRVVPVQPESA